MKLERRLANLGYGSRREVRRLFARRAVTSPDGLHLQANDIDVGQDILVHGEPLDPRPPIVLALHKPVGAECTRKGDGPTVYDLLPPRFLARSPKLAPVGRLDKDTTGLLLLTDDGELLHRLTHPRHHVDKRYLLRTARPLQPGLSSLFASGTMRLKSDSRPLLPAEFTQTALHEGTLVLQEGRYHQVRRMLAATGNHVERLHRDRVGPLHIGELKASEWRRLAPSEVRQLHQAVGLGTT